MEAIVFDKKAGVPLRYVKNHSIPTIVNDTDVVVKVAYSGVCGTDIHIIQGIFPSTNRGHLILGHEFCGTVVKSGSKAAFETGQRVVVDPNGGCNLCKVCHSGKYHLCKIGGINNTLGIFRDGGWGQYCLVPDLQVFALPDSISFEQAALCEPLSCLAHGWDRMSPVNVGDNIMIAGAGIIGNLWSILLHLQGHRDVTVSEPNENRRSLAKDMDLGFKYVTPEELEKSGELFDLIIDCTGVSKVLEWNFKFLDDGAKYVVFGCGSPNETSRINPFVIYKKELTIIGVNINPFTFPKALGFIASLTDRYLSFEKLGIKTFSLSQYEEAIDALKAGIISKVVFKIE